MNELIQGIPIKKFPLSFTKIHGIPTENWR